MAREHCVGLSERLREYAGVKNSCWEVQQSTLGGRGLFATQPIKKGSLIFNNKPVVIGARADVAANIHCTKCYQISDSCVPCEKCQLILCSDICKLSQEHSTECHYIATYLKPKDKSEENSAVLARILIYFRFLLLSDERKAVMKLLQRDCSLSSFQELDALCSRYFISQEDKDKIIVIDSILKTNSFRVASSSNEKKVPVRGLYPLSAFLNHSCLPNTRNVFMADHTMAVYATQNIGVGEEIVSCYTGLLWCTPARRYQLYKSKTFWCTCARCSDPSEKGTNLSALKCLNTNCIGVLLPTDPLDERTSWCCDNCDSKVLADRVNIVQSVLGSLVGTLQLDDKFNLESAVLERLASFVPYSNHIFVDIRLRLACKLGNNGGTCLNELQESRLALKESLCRGTLRTLAALGVGDAHLRGLLLYHLHAALAERARRSPELYEELKSEIESTIEQAYNILQGDISSPPDLELRRKYLGPGCDKPQEERFFILDASDTCVST